MIQKSLRLDHNTDALTKGAFFSQDTKSILLIYVNIWAGKILNDSLLSSPDGLISFPKSAVYENIV